MTSPTPTVIGETSVQLQVQLLDTGDIVNTGRGVADITDAVTQVALPTLQGQRGPQGVKGDTGVQGPPGATGGQGQPTGGTAGQVLRKQSGTDYDAAYSDDNRIGGVTVTGTPAAGRFVQASSATAATWVDPAVTQNTVARYRRTTAPSTTTAGDQSSATRVVGVSFSATAGRLYHITTSALSYVATGSTNVATVETALVYTTDGSTPVASSPLLITTDWQCPAGANSTSGIVSGYLAATATGTVRVTLTYFAAVLAGANNIAMSGSASRPIDLVVRDMGVDPGSSGTSY